MKIARYVVLFIITLLVVSTIYTYLVAREQTFSKIDSLLENSRSVSGDAVRGEYVAIAAGCIACHTNFDEGGELLAGGVAITTPFGTFYSPNISSDEHAGIGKWSTDEFLLALAMGLSPDRKHYYPAFPYTSYTAMSIQDIVDLKAWLHTVLPVSPKAPDHEVVWPISMRFGLQFWKALYFEPLPANDVTDRGRYLVAGPGHCAGCHAPRNLLGGLRTRSLTGNSRGPDGNSVPGITSGDLAMWSVEDLELFFEIGITPAGDFTGGHMADVIEHGTGRMSLEDRSAIARYLLSEANRP